MLKVNHYQERTHYYIKKDDVQAFALLVFIISMALIA